MEAVAVGLVSSGVIFVVFIVRNGWLSWLLASPSWSCQVSSPEPQAWSGILCSSPVEMTLIKGPSNVPALARWCDVCVPGCLKSLLCCYGLPDPEERERRE